jgi:hypothetical protein
MSLPPREQVRHVEITRADRVRRLGQLLALLGALPLLAAAASPLVPEGQRGVAFALAFVLAMAVVTLFLLVPPLLAMLARSKLRTPLGLAARDGALGLVDPAGRTHWQVPLSDVGVAWQRAPRTVEVVTAGGDEAQLSFGTSDDARAAVAFVRRHARDRRAYALSLESDVRRLWRVGVAWALPSSIAGAAVLGDPALWPMVPVALGLSWLAGRGTPKVWLGADGVIVEGRFSRRHVPYRTIRAVEHRTSTFGSSSVVLSLVDGRHVRIAHGLSSDRAALTHALVQEGLRMVERGEAAGAAAGALASSGRGVREWLQAVRGAARRADYRGAALDAERLLSIVRNPAAEAGQRIAAALALRSEPSGVARLRVAAEVSTEPVVREALEVLADDSVDDQRMERMLRRLAARA